MSEYAVEKLEQQPLVTDATYIDPSTDSENPEGAVVVVAGTPNDGDVPVYVAANNRYENQAPTGGGSGLVLLEEHIASATATWDFYTRNAAGQSGATFQSDFDTYLLEVLSAIPQTSNVDLYWRASTDGSTPITTNSYSYVDFIAIPAGNGQAGANPAAQDAKVILTCSGNGVKDTASWGVCGSYTIMNPLSTSMYKRIHGQSNYVRHADTAICNIQVSGAFVSTTAMVGMQILFNSGNIDTGIARLYGVAK